MLFYRKLLFLLLPCLLTFSLSAQNLSLGIGGNASNLRDHNLLDGHNKFAFGYNMSFILRYDLFKNTPDLIFQNEVMFEFRGYQIEIDGDSDHFIFHYVNFPVLIGYKVIDELKISGGFYLGLANSLSIYQKAQGFRKFDAGLIFDITLFEEREGGFYFRINYGLTPVLDYQRIDDFGNFLEEESLFKFISFQFGANINFPLKR